MNQSLMGGKDEDVVIDDDGEDGEYRESRLFDERVRGWMERRTGFQLQGN